MQYEEVSLTFTHRAGFSDFKKFGLQDEWE